MNDFTKEELKKICEIIFIHDDLNDCNEHQDLIFKIQRMIDKYPSLNAKWLAKSHLNEAESLISHAKCLLGMDNDNQ